MNHESSMNNRLQNSARFTECKESLKHTAQLYKSYCKRVLEGLDAAIIKNNYSAASFAGRQVVMARGF